MEMALAGAMKESGALATPSTTLRVLSPRRATVALDAAGPAQDESTRLPPTATTLYDKQLLWKKHTQKKLESRSHDLLRQADDACTFLPKTNQPQRGPSLRAPSVSTIAVHAARVTDVVQDGGSSECSSQYSASPLTMQSVDSMDLREYNRRGRHGHDADEHEDGAMDGAEEDEEERGRGPIHPTESQESSILLHLARQERAREEAQRAKSKLWSTQPPKDFTKVTAAKPFELSRTNRKPRRSLSTSPTHRARPRASSSSNSVIATHIGSSGVGQAATTPPKQSTKRRPQSVLQGEDEGGDTHGATLESSAQSWLQERTTLLSVIESQRRELEERETAQQEARRLAESFADAVTTVEKRLEVVEQTTSTELTELKALVARQTAATELILHALGLDKARAGTSPLSSPIAPHTPPLAASSPVSAATASTRRETK